MKATLPSKVTPPQRVAVAKNGAPSSSSTAAGSPASTVPPAPPAVAGAVALTTQSGIGDDRSTVAGLGTGVADVAPAAVASSGQAQGPNLDALMWGQEPHAAGLPSGQSDAVRPSAREWKSAVPISAYEAKSEAPAVADPRASAVADPPGMDEPMVRRAAALRTKYRRPGGSVRIPVEQVGFHPKNRDGQPPNGSRCLELFKEILEVGFDGEESDNGGIVVEATAGSSTIHKFNRDACDGDPFHAPVVTGWIVYGSLSHSHLHQVLRNIRGAAPCNIPAVSDFSGTFSLMKLRTVDGEFARAVDTGLL